jgi:hypothetical protein
MSAFTDHLATDRHFKPPTVRNYSLEITKCCTWFVLFYTGDTGLEAASLLSIQQVNRAICAAARKADKRNRCDDRSCSMAEQVLHRRMPAGGMEELQAAVMKELPWVATLENSNIDKESYNRFMGVMYAALYAFSPQGRQAGVMDMRYHQHVQLLRVGYADSTMFKTALAFQYQSVTSSEIADFLLRLYLRHVRCCATPQDPEDMDALFLTYQGAPEKLLGKRLTSFFKRTLDLHITTTAMRSMVETMTDRMYLTGEISQEVRAAVQNINGHSSRITQDYYVRRDQANMVSQARNVFTGQAQAHLPQYDPGEEDWSDVQEPVASPPWQPHSAGGPMPGWPVADQLRPADWGTEHPNYNSQGGKAQWTQQEVTYIGRWCEQEAAGTGWSTNLVARCLRFLVHDPAALPIFHKNHVLDGQRLRHGYRIYMEQVKKGQWVSH